MLFGVYPLFIENYQNTICSSAWDFPLVGQLMITSLSLPVKLKIIHKSRFFFRVWWEQLWPSVVSLWQKDENVLFISVFIYCEEMEKWGERPSSQTVLGKKRNKASSQISAGVFSATEEANVIDVRLFTVFTRREWIFAWISPSFL